MSATKSATLVRNALDASKEKERELGISMISVSMQFFHDGVPRQLRNMSLDTTSSVALGETASLRRNHQVVAKPLSAARWLLYSIIVSS